MLKVEVWNISELALGQKKSCQDFAQRASLTTVPPYLKIK